MDYQTTKERLTKQLFTDTSPVKLILGIVVVATIVGAITGYILSTKGSSQTSTPLVNSKTPKTAQQDIKTFRDFAEGIIKLRPQPKNSNEYVEGTHLLERAGAMPVALTSSVVDLSEYEGKKVKVFGETQKAVKEGWLMDVGKVEEIK